MRRIVWLAVLCAIGISAISSGLPHAFSDDSPLLRLIESDAPQVQRSGHWTAQASPSASGGSYLYSSGNAEDALTLHFSGAQVEIVYVKHPALGALALEVDRVVLRTVVAAADQPQFRQRAVIHYLDDGPHVLRVYAVQGAIAIDAFWVAESRLDLLPTASSGIRNQQTVQQSRDFFPGTAVDPRFFSHDIIPPTIRVAITGYVDGNDWAAAGYPIIRVDTLDLREYTKNVLPNEWISSWHPNALRAGAMAVKMYAWRRVNNPRSASYDIVDNTYDQVYIANSSRASTNTAVDETFGSMMRRNGQVISIHYVDTDAHCQQWFPPGTLCMGQWGSQNWALQGYDWQWILNHYYGPVDFTPFVPPQRVALFNTDFGWVSLVNSLQDWPPLGLYLNYAAGAPVQGQWVMGDWNGDGQATPGVFSNGAFWYTNRYGQTTDWSGVWIGPPNGKPVAGRFTGAVSHDCFGLVVNDSGLWWSCDLTSAAPVMSGQWLGSQLAWLSGDPQFVAGDFDGDGIDSLAMRRNEYITWTNVPPSTVMAQFTQAQYIGAPGPAGQYGQLAAGDWNNDAVSSFGLFYPGGEFYRRNDLEWNTSVYFLQRVGQPIGAPVQAAGWR